jgi:hypothetical protein
MENSIVKRFLNSFYLTYIYIYLRLLKKINKLKKKFFHKN